MTDKRYVESAIETSAAGVVTRVSPWSVSTTIARMGAVVAAREMKLFAVIDFGEEARSGEVRCAADTRLVIFGNPSAAASEIAATPLAALDLPVRVVVWEDGYETKISYATPDWSASRDRMRAESAASLSNVDAVIDSVIDR
jgi:uncharacterized protein (DUF302 family)